LGSMALGVLLDASTFLELSTSSGVVFSNCVIQLNIPWRQFEIYFDARIDEHAVEKYKICLPFRYITQDSLTLNRNSPDAGYHSIFFETSVPPQMWKKSETVDDEDLKDRFFWGDQELWMRQCGFFRETGDDSPTALLDTRVITKASIVPLGNLTHRIVLTFM
jgi:hypothetical protein